VQLRGGKLKRAEEHAVIVDAGVEVLSSGAGGFKLGLHAHIGARESVDSGSSGGVTAIFQTV
jgi:hypothetical protein